MIFCLEKIINEIYQEEKRTFHTNMNIKILQTQEKSFSYINFNLHGSFP